MKLILSSILALGLALCATAEEEKKADDKKDSYPLETCVISGEKLGDHGEPYVFEHDGKEVKLCCKGCLKDFKEDPEKHLEKIDKARESKEEKKD